MGSAILHFVIGGIAVALASIIADKVGGKLGGIIATMPAVFLVSMFITGMQYGDKVAVHVSRGAVFGMTGVLVCILVTWMMLHMTHMWLISIVVGFLSWFISAVCIFEAVEFIAQKRLEKHSWKAGKSNSK
ncbi:TPA: DUF3147 family protein [Staphylococcus aureus]|nr:DUF3147 family protein [Staphylococcus aureus]HDA8046266.1 DUF3147 family protein [Staphylococcus aureus]